MSRERLKVLLLYLYELLLYWTVSITLNLAIFIRMEGSHSWFHAYARLFTRLTFYFNAKDHAYSPRSILGIEAAAISLIAVWALYLFVGVQLLRHGGVERLVIRWLGVAVTLLAAPIYWISLAFGYDLSQASTVESTPKMIELKFILVEIAVALCLMFLLARRGMPRLFSILLFVAHNTVWLYLLLTTDRITIHLTIFASSKFIPIASLAVGVIWLFFMQRLSSVAEDGRVLTPRYCWSAMALLLSVASVIGVFLVRNQPSHLGF
jgi:hypothetical protein